MADIAERARDPRLQALYDEGVNVYSFSKLGTINSCLYGAWRTYILHDRGSGSVYTELGTASHQAIEDFIEGKASFVLTSKDPHTKDYVWRRFFKKILL